MGRICEMPNGDGKITRNANGEMCKWQMVMEKLHETQMAKTKKQVKKEKYWTFSDFDIRCRKFFLEN